MGLLQDWGKKISDLNPVRTAQQKQPDQSAVAASQAALQANKSLAEAELAKAGPQAGAVKAQAGQAALSAAPQKLAPATVTGQRTVTPTGLYGSAAEQKYLNTVQGNQIQRGDVRQLSSGGLPATQAQIDVSQSNAAREQQQRLLEMLLAPQAGPTAEQQTMQRNADRAIAQQMGLAAAATGNPALAQRNASLAAAEIAGEATAQSAALGEQQRNKNLEIAANLTQGMRGTDLSAQELALKTQQANIATQEAEKSRALEAQIRNAGYDYEIVKRNADAGDAASLEMLGNARKDVDAQFAADQLNAANLLDVSKFNAATVNQAQQYDVDAAMKSGQFNATQIQDMVKFNEQARLQTELANVDNQLKARGMDDTKRLEVIQLMSGMDQAAMQNEMARLGIRSSVDAANVAAKSAMTGAILQGVTGIGAAAVKGGATGGPVGTATAVAGESKQLAK